MALYSFGGAYPSAIPARLKFPDGTTKTDPSTFTQDDLVYAGYTQVPDKPSITNTQVLSWDSVIVSWSVRDKTAEELQQELNAAWAILRSQRNALLRESDWTQLADATVNSLAWANYRQELRDLPANTQNPYSPIWPTPPE